MWVVPSAVTWRSSIASSSADWVRGAARLISSARRMLQNTGPGWNSNVSRPRCHTVTPVMSEGRRSGVHCTRRQVDSIDAAIALARLVLPTPGTSSIRRWPSASRQMSANSIVSRLPCTAGRRSR